MARKVSVDQLVGAAEIAQRLGLGSASTVHQWHRRHGDFPKPVTTLIMGHVWNWPDVERWAKATGRL